MEEQVVKRSPIEVCRLAPFYVGEIFSLSDATLAFLLKCCRSKSRVKQKYVLHHKKAFSVDFCSPFNVKTQHSCRKTDASD